MGNWGHTRARPLREIGRVNSHNEICESTCSEDHRGGGRGIGGSHELFWWRFEVWLRTG